MIESEKSNFCFQFESAGAKPVESGFLGFLRFKIMQEPMLAGGESTMGSGYGQAGALISKIQNSVIGSTIGGREPPSP